LATHCPLSNLGVAGDLEESELIVAAGFDKADADLGAPKKDVMLASVLDFLASAGVEVGRLSALRFTGPQAGEDIVVVDREGTRRWTLRSGFNERFAARGFFYKQVMMAEEN
jgi:hypothetical protein